MRRQWGKLESVVSLYDIYTNRCRYIFEGGTKVVIKRIPKHAYNY